MQRTTTARCASDLYEIADRLDVFGQSPAMTYCGPIIQLVHCGRSQARIKWPTLLPVRALAARERNRINQSSVTETGSKPCVRANSSLGSIARSILSGP